MKLPKDTCSIVNKVCIDFWEINSIGKREDLIDFKNELITHEQLN